MENPQYYTEEEIDLMLGEIDSRPYKVYTALLTQTGTNAPVATVIENTLGATITYERAYAGAYLLRSSNTSLFAEIKTVVFVNNSAESGNYWGSVIYSMEDPSYVVFNTFNTSNINADNVMKRASIEIRVYN